MISCLIGWVQSFVGIFGFCANITGLHILRKKQHDNSTNFYSLMLLLSIFDLAYICMSLLTFSLNKFSMSYQEYAWGYIVPWSIPILQISLTGSIYCTMAITLERYFVICRPFYRFSRHWKSSTFILPILIISIVYNIPRFCERITCEETTSTEVISNETISVHSTKHCGGYIDNDKHLQHTISQRCAVNISGTTYQPGITTTSVFVTFTNLKLDKRYQLYSFFSNLVLNLLIPYIFIFVLNTLVVLNLRKNQLDTSPDSREEADNQTGTNFMKHFVLVISIYI